MSNKLPPGTITTETRYGGARVAVCADLPTFGQATIERLWPSTLADGPKLADFIGELFEEFEPMAEVVVVFDNGTGPYKALLAEATQRQVTEDHAWKQVVLEKGTLHVMQNKVHWRGK